MGRGLWPAMGVGPGGWMQETCKDTGHRPRARVITRGSLPQASPHAEAGAACNGRPAMSKDAKRFNVLNRTLKAPPIRGLMEPRQSGLSPVSGGFVLRGFWQTDKSLETTSRESGAADAQRRPAGVKEKRGLGALRGRG